MAGFISHIGEGIDGGGHYVYTYKKKQEWITINYDDDLIAKVQNSIRDYACLCFFIANYDDDDDDDNDDDNDDDES